MAKNLKKIKDEILGVVSVLSSIYLALSLFSYTKLDPSFFTFTHSTAGNYGGIAGAYLSDLSITLIGFSAWSLPAFLAVYGIRRLLGMEKHKVYLAGSILFMFSSSLMFSLVLSTFNVMTENSPGGITGRFVSQLLKNYLSPLGAYICSLSLFLSSLVLLTPVPLASFRLRKDKPKIKDQPKEVGKRILEEDILIKDELPKALPVFAEPPAHPETIKKPVKAVSEQVNMQATITKEGYELPSVELLKSYDSSYARPSNDELRANTFMLESKLADFDVEGKITHVNPGPVVTMYEFEPAPGVKINKVVSLADDLALSLKSQSLRVSPIHGKNTIGIEVPNKLREIVSFKEILSSDTFRKGQSRLTLALGKNIAGESIIADLTKMPHLLVAGSTGSGKSVSINSMVMSILYKATPKEVKMLMIDPKLLELSMYEDIPHLVAPVITNPRQAAEALRKMVFEMERRYRALAEKGARNIDSFNRSVPDEEQIPYIVVFIDELADLMFASSREVEDSITRLAQMARAAGIHLIIATQRPSVDVITGIIKANFPARISFQVFSKIDSRTILDSQGAEQLLGKGDMLMMLPGSKITRVHGAFVTEDEIHAVTKFIKAQGSPDYSFFETIPTEPPPVDEDNEDRDDIYDKALEFGESAGEVSISSIQRRFKIGFNRAARIIEMMEDDGLVGPPKGAGKPRDFLGRTH
ncbi:MAG: cell division protein FtsK [Nitrospira bacterium HGW-Nitrospira-1]|nr:MAG: cell division protein FtsK [Nitrospira bacterium HGW-Nitrospira-1]